ncbi:MULTISPECIES: hypothetical protein [unclassified Pseudovibrio]|uniref:hypothetical protein n=1 Tax=unclassified Pseudovibrio TaxID=2627060 RepID=UPI0007AE564F|nr:MULTISPECIES: hypothetical protein [unclassified Pseudovibrio]KZL02292.1 hypothetical protein PsW74_01390 [Pseudovibrio sp. W74]KZL08164.1 hypothetical protein PsAD14_03311 [Pseudovibrio sp. Ad14]
MFLLSDTRLPHDEHKAARKTVCVDCFSPALALLPISVAFQLFQIPFLCLHQLGSAAWSDPSRGSGSGRQSARLPERCQR